MNVKMNQSNFLISLPHKRNVDQRGVLTSVDSISAINVKRLYLIEPEMNNWRGKHYHKMCNQTIILLQGGLECKTIEEATSRLEEFCMKPGDVYAQNVGTTFSFNSTLPDTKLIVLCDREFEQEDYYESEVNFV